MGAVLQHNFLAAVTFRVRREAQYCCCRGGVDSVERPSARRIRSLFSGSVMARKKDFASDSVGHLLRPICLS
jgi:hypothetical protein